MIDQAVVGRAVAVAAGLPTALVLLVVAAVALRVMTRVLGRLLGAAGVDDLGISLATGALRVAGWAAALAGAFSIVGLQEVALTLGGTVALLAVGVGSALSGMVTDFLSGMFLLADQELRVGRSIQAAGVQGEVVSLDVRKTKVRDAEGRLHVIPNRAVDGAAYVVWGEGGRR